MHKKAASCKFAKREDHSSCLADETNSSFVCSTGDAISGEGPFFGHAALEMQRRRQH
jgi:hypothetical protein